VLHIALEELPSGCAQQMLAREVWTCERQRHDVL